MKPIFKEVPSEDDSSPISPFSAMTALTPLSPFAFLYLHHNFSSFSAFSLLADSETKKAESLEKIKTVCGCSKTKCLKLYCECFTEGKYCQDCDCRNCHNTSEYKEERDSIMERTKLKNPGAFRKDISANYKICHCSKSFCQKRYCECFQSGRPCNANCKCKHCKNVAKFEEM